MFGLPRRVTIIRRTAPIGFILLSLATVAGLLLRWDPVNRLYDRQVDPSTRIRAQGVTNSVPPNISSNDKAAVPIASPQDGVQAAIEADLAHAKARARRKDPYSKAFAEMQLSDPTVRRLRELISVPRRAGKERQEGLSQGKFATRQEAMDHYDAICAEAELEIRSLLTADQYGQFEKARTEVPARELMTGYAIYLDSSKSNLPDAAYEQMVSLVQPTYQRYQVNIDYPPWTTFVPRAWLDNYTARRQSEDEAIIRSASPFFAPNQMDVLRTFLSVQTTEGAARKFKVLPAK